MSEILKSTQRANKGSGTTLSVDYTSKDTQTREEGIVRKTQTKEPTTTESKKSAHETVTRQEPTESQQTQTEDIGLTVTFAMNIRNFL